MNTLEDRPLSEEDQQVRKTVLKALKNSGARVTIGDVVAKSGLSRDDADTGLKSLLNTHEGHLEVSDDGELVYLFDPKLVRRDDRSGWQKFKEKAWDGFKAGFKVWIMLMLVVYFIIYVTMAIAAFIAITSQNRDSNRSSSFGRSRHGGGGGGLYFLLYLFWTPDWRYRDNHYYGNSAYGSSRQSKAPSIPFYKKVFAYVFGPDEMPVDLHERDRAIAQFIRGRRGVITTAELVEFTGTSFAEADSEMGRLLGAFNGDVHVSEEGEVIYSFPELLLSAEGPVKDKDVTAAWNKLEVPKELTGNSTKENTIISGFNGFNLLFALISPVMLFPILRISGVAADIGLVVVPLIFSLMFFAVPLLRTIAVKRENSRRHERNVRRLVLKKVYTAAKTERPLVADDVVGEVKRSLSEVKTNGETSVINKTLEEAVADFDAEVDTDHAGRHVFDFPTIRRAYAEGEAFRKKLALDKQKIGEIIFSSADDTQQAEERELKEFAKELEEAKEPEEHEVH